jgi:hypothetical protein
LVRPVARARRAIRASRVLPVLRVRIRPFLGLLARRVLPARIRRCLVRRARLGLLALRALRDRRVRGVCAAKRARLARRATSVRLALRAFRGRRAIRVLLAGLARRASRVLAARRANRAPRVRKGRRAFLAFRGRRELRVCLWIFRARSRRMRIFRRPLLRVTPMLLPRMGNFTFMTALRGRRMAAVFRSRVRLVRRVFRGRRV